MDKKLLLMGCALGAALTLPAENLIKNGNFEEEAKNWIVPSWIKHAAKLQFDGSDMPGAGRAALKLVAADGKLPILYQQFKFVPGVTSYKVSFSAKIKDFNNWGWFIIHVESEKTRKRYFGQTVGAGAGTNNSRPWKTYSKTISIPAEEGGNPARVTIVFGGKTTGTAWIDDLIIEPVAGTPPVKEKKTTAPDKTPAKTTADVKKKISLIPEAADSDLNLINWYWEPISWIPNINFIGPSTTDFTGTIPAGKCLALMQRTMSVHANCDGPFRFSTWLKVPAAASPFIQISTFPQKSSQKADYRTWVIPPTGKVKDGFAEYAADFIVPDKTAELRVSLRTLRAQNKDIQVSLKDSRLRPIVLPGKGIALHDIAFMGDYGMFMPNETPGAKLIFRNAEKTAKKLAVHFVVHDYFGNKIKSFDRELSLPAQSLSTHKILVEGLKQWGFYSVDCTWKNGTVPEKADFSFVRVAPKPENPDRAFGITFIGDTIPIASAMTRLGAGTKGVRVPWRQVERPDGSYDWSLVDRSVEACLRNNLKIIGGFEMFSGHVPGKYLVKNAPKVTNADQVFTKEYFDAAVKFEKAAVERYKKHIKEWAFMGEIDLLISFNKYERDHYVKRILRSAPELRKIHPEIEMTAIGCSGGDGRHLPRFKVMRSLWKDLKTVLDGVSPDQYTMPSTYGPGNQPVDSESGLLREIMLEAYKIIRRDNKSVLSIDEKGPHIVYDLPMNNPYARNMANVVVRDYVIVKSLPVKHWLYYGWNRWRDGGTLDYGLWKGPSPRHTVAAYAAAARLLANVKFVKKADLHKSVPFFLFTGKQGTVGVIWRSGNGKNISMMTRFPDDAKLFDVQGNEVKISSGGNTIELSDAPLYIFTKETPDQLASLLQKAKMSLPELGTTIVMQSRDKVLVYLNNLTNKKLIVDCSFAGVKRKLTLPASGAVQAEFPAGKSFLSGEELQVKTAQGFVYRNLFKIDPVPVERVASFEALKKAAPTFKLDSAELHLNNIDYAANGLYSGPADCSVEVRMGYDDRNLYLNAVVTDDIHTNESEQRVMAWSGDCIQFGFDPLSDAKIKALQGKNIFCDDDLLFTVAKMKRMDLFDTNFKPEGADLSKVRYSIKRDEKKKTTTYDAVIPLSSLTSLKVVPGTVFGFNFIAMDSDEAREIPKYWMQYSPGIAGGLNPALFKSFMFK